MNDDRILEFMAQVSDYMRATDRRFEQLITVMHTGFERVNTQIGQLINEVRATNQRVDVLTEEVRATNQRVDVLTEEVREVKVDLRDIKAENQTANRRLQATFEQAGQLTEANTEKEGRLIKLETEVPSNAELHRRVLALEEQMRRAS